MNNEFTEMDHAWIAAMYYQELKEKYKDNGINAFIFMTQKYGEQRGSRMAQRALKDGRALDFAAYREYTEWKATEISIKEKINNSSEIVSFDPDFEVHIFRCPWAAQFKRMHMEEAGKVYCSYIDASLVRGFHPALHYETVQNLNDAEYCIQKCPGAYLKSLTSPLHPEYILGFDYHCAHLFWIFARLTKSIFNDENIPEDILHAFGKEAGTEKANLLQKYRFTDFDVIP